MTEKEKWNEILTQLLAEQDFVLIFGESNISFREEFKNFQSKFTLNLSSCNMQWDETSPSGSQKRPRLPLFWSQHPALMRDSLRSGILKLGPCVRVPPSAWCLKQEIKFGVWVSTYLQCEITQYILFCE